jgi:hypothetical protein
MLVQKIPALDDPLIALPHKSRRKRARGIQRSRPGSSALDAREGALNHRLVKVEFQFLWLRGAEGIPIRFPNALRAGGIKLHDTIEIPPFVGNPNASWIAKVMAPSGRSPQAPCRERCSFHSASSSKICFQSLRNSILSGLTASFVVSHSDWRRGRDSDPLSRKKVR